ncbi:riboflavin-specific deaminase C-terminal domain-containing protein [Arboricoccus pini]|uniref:Riboflavin-specific deaminase C-terminal domain-containing protein n=1 Tax=Arboricoccus pini TaxID=1963835 RepID=A0A212Q709_9PROT|nr:RibD family protein [Arboricoccus pini]SNB55158.1 riboflavin-specific deaminase C-terminal domain-containing protein [Arboricoccus pini]
MERQLAQSYLDFLTPAADGLSVLAHLGQSLDGRIATSSGHSTYVTGKADLVHMHRLRALADAVLVGGGTVASDDPQLTVRLVEGPSPLRVVIDTRRKLTSTCRLFRGGPPTLVLCREDRQEGPELGNAELLGLPSELNGSLAPATILDWLRRRGIRRIFIEGGGITVSRFLASGCLDRLQLCIAPVVIGSGREALRLPAVATMDEALRLKPVVIPMGSDWLFDCDLKRRPLPVQRVSGEGAEPYAVASEEIVVADKSTSDALFR